MKKEVRPEDICTHGGEDYHMYHGAVIAPIFQNTLFIQKKEDPFRSDEYVYTRINNPTLELAEKKLAALEGAESALVFSSGMAAISAGISSFIQAGDHVVCVENVYGPTRMFLEQYLKKYRVSVSFISGERKNDYETAIRPETRLFFLESPTSFTFKLQDLKEVSRIAQHYNIKTIIDNTWATPLFQQPLTLGVDLVAHSASKYLGGHSDIVGGVLAGSSQLIQAIRERERAWYGAVMDPHQAWLLTRGLRTLPLRMRQHQQNAMQIAIFLDQHPQVSEVLYPALSSHPQHQLAITQMNGFSSLMSFILKGETPQVDRFIEKLRIFQLACSWGGFESLVIPIGRGMEENTRRDLGIHENLIRIHIGLENVDSLIQDLLQALT